MKSVKAALAGHERMDQRSIVLHRAIADVEDLIVIGSQAVKARIRRQYKEKT